MKTIPMCSHWPELWHQVDDEHDQVYPRTVLLMLRGQRQALSQPPDADTEQGQQAQLILLSDFSPKCKNTSLCEPSEYVICQ